VTTTYTIECQGPGCPVSFEAVHHDARYCSSRCRSRAFRRGKSGRPNLRPVRTAGSGVRPAEVPDDLPRIFPAGDVSDVQARALRLRIAGLGWKQIADEVGLGSPAEGQEAVGGALRALSRLELTNPDVARQLELERLDGLERNVRVVMQQASSGRTADPQMVLSCIDRLLKISAARQALMEPGAAHGSDHGPTPLDRIKRRL
jgi:hypothetical protein